MVAVSAYQILYVRSLRERKKVHPVVATETRGEMASRMFTVDEVIDADFSLSDGEVSTKTSMLSAEHQSCPAMNWRNSV